MTVEMSTSFPDHQPPSGAEETLDDWVDLAVEQEKVTTNPPAPGRRITIPSVAVTVNGNETHDYSHVISTLPLSILRTVDLNGAGLNVMQKNALRTLKYTSALKIALLFKSNWWTTKLGIVGGQTFTDLPIGMIVYPSYGVDSGIPSKVLIASYCAKLDASRLGSLATMKSQETLLDLVLRNLAEVHKGVHPDVTYAYLREEVVDMHVKDWDREEYAMGTVDSTPRNDVLIIFSRGVRLLWTRRIPRFVCVAHLPCGEQTLAFCGRGNEYASRVSDIRLGG